MAMGGAAAATTAAVAGSSLPSQEVSSSKPFEKSSGISALPGKNPKPAVAALPEEHSRGGTSVTSAVVGTHGRTYGATSLPIQDDAARATVS